MNNVAELQLQLHRVIDTIKDKEKLSAVYTILKGSIDPFSPMSLDEYVNAIDESRKQTKDGKFVEVENLEKESENW